MGNYRTLITSLLGSALLSLACTSQALTLTQAGKTPGGSA